MAQVDPLAGPLSRLRVTYQEINSLERAIDAACKVDPCTLSYEFDPNERWHICRAKIGKSNDPIWGITVGEILHNLRAALDEIAWKLACIYTPALLTPQILSDHKLAQHARQIQFPIFLHADNPGNKRGVSAFNVTGTKLHLRLIDPSHRALFERHQPYSGNNGGERDPLWILKEMNDTDKHRLIHFTGVALRDLRYSLPDGKTMTLGEGAMIDSVKSGRWQNPPGGFVDGAELCRFRNDGEAEVQVKIDLATEIRFDKSCGPGAGLHVIRALGLMHNRVGKIVESFYPAFPI